MGEEVVQNSRNVPGEWRYILQTEVGVGSSIHLNRQCRRNHVYWWFWCICGYDEQDGFITRRIGTRQSVSTPHDCGHGVWVDRHHRGGHCLRERLGHVPHGRPTLWGHFSGVIFGKLCEENGYSFEWQECQTPNLMKNDNIALCKCDNFVLVVVLGRSSEAHLSNSASDSAENTKELTLGWKRNDEGIDKSIAGFASQAATGIAQFVYAISHRP